MGKRGRRRVRERARSELHVVVVGGASLTLDSMLVELRAAVLYADHVTVCSPTMSFLGDLAAFGALSGEEMAVAVVEIAIATGQVPPEILRHPDAIREIMRQLGGDNDLSAAAAQLAEVAQQQAEERGAGDVLLAARAGIVDIERFEMRDPDRGVEQFFDRMKRLVRDPLRYPLFADDVVELARTMRDRGDVRTAAVTQVGLASGFMAKLPTFPGAPMDELIDVRESLRRPLTSFRAEMVRLASTCGATPLDDDFDGLLQDAWIRDVQPALDELDAEIEENNLIRAYGGPLAKFGGIGTLLAGIVTQNPSVASVVGATTGLGAVAISGAEQRERHRRSLNSSPYYFLHQLASSTA